MDAAACHCGCTAPGRDDAHRVAGAVADGDFDRAIQAGLLACEPCPACTPQCRDAVIAIRDARRAALAARERYRNREARLRRRAAERDAARAVRSSPTADATAAPARPALPPAAAAALARARAKAAGTRAR